MVGLFPGDACILMPGNVVEARPLAGQGRRGLGADMLDRTAGDLRSDKRFDRIQQTLVPQKSEGSRATRLHDVQAFQDFRRLRIELRGPLLKRRVLMSFHEFAFRRQRAGITVD
jgi:hypothetical protein